MIAYWTPVFDYTFDAPGLLGPIGRSHNRWRVWSRPHSPPPKKAAAGPRGERGRSTAELRWRSEQMVSRVIVVLVMLTVVSIAGSCSTRSVRDSAAESVVAQSARVSVAETQLAEGGGDVDAPMISKRALLRTVLGTALTAAAVFIPDNWSSEWKWAVKASLSTAGGITTILFGDTPDHNSMARDRVNAIASCIAIKGSDVILEAVDQATVSRVCPTVLRPPTAEAREIAERTVSETFRRAYDVTEGERAGGLAPFVSRVQSRDHGTFVRELLAAASRLGQ